MLGSTVADGGGARGDAVDVNGTSVKFSGEVRISGVGVMSHWVVGVGSSSSSATISVDSWQETKAIAHRRSKG
jgi:hypothetical protein